MQRRLAAILAADMVGFSRRMQADEDGTLIARRYGPLACRNENGLRRGDKPPPPH